ncbi:MAG: Flagellar hook-length control protein FliK [Bacillales bacterium]|nr:Flagellar hook-length control protein FliK [Bacillales bacterium]
MNVNLNSFLTNISQDAVLTNKLSGGDKSAFINMLTMMIEGKSEVQDPLGNSGVNLNFIELFTSINNMSANNPSDENAANIDVFNKIISDKQDKQEDNKSDLLVEVQNYLNIVAPSIIKTEPQLQTENLSEIVNTGYVQASKTPYINFNNKQVLKTDDNGNIRNIINDELIVKSSIAETEVGKIFQLESSYEKLATEKQDQIEGQKNKTNLQTEILAAESTLVKEQNTIIKISDEASQLKPQVLSQIKDKIVFMTEEGPEPGNTAKHVTMELHPISLGKVDIKMTFENNKITVEIKAMNEETQKLISSNADELAKVLGKASESINIIVKSNESQIEHQLFNSNHSEQKNEQGFNHDEQNYEQGRQKNNHNHYYHEDNNDSEDDNIFSQLINLRNIKLGV